MDTFADVSAVYVRQDGVRFEGQDAIRVEFAPMFAGDFGEVRFHVEDAIADSSNGKVTATWVCSTTREGEPGKEWKGLDIFTVKGSKVVSKETFAQAAKLQLHDVGHHPKL
jgi:hypothetical protein